MIRDELNKIASYLYQNNIEPKLHQEIWNQLKIVSCHSRSDVKISKSIEAKIQKHKAAAARHYSKPVAAKKRRK